MLFLSKRDNSSTQSSTETCVSILGLILAIGIIGGLAALIYGLIKGNISGTIGGGVILGVSVLFSIILVLVFIFCLKNNNINANIGGQRANTHHRQHKQNRHHKQNRQTNQERSTSHEITVISGIHKYDDHPQQQQQSNEHNARNVVPLYPSNGLGDSTNLGYGKQLPQSPSKTSSFNFLNQSNASIKNPYNQSPINANTNQNNSNRY